jgi:hypothetical protein
MRHKNTTGVARYEGDHPTASRIIEFFVRSLDMAQLPLSSGVFEETS